MTKGLPRSLSRGSQSTRQVVKESIAINEVMTFTGATGAVVFATAPIAGLAEGNILLLGAVATVTFTGPTSADLSDTFAGDFGIGTTPEDDNTITGTDVDIIASTAIPAAVAEVSADVRGTHETQEIIDNTDGSGEINLNVLIDANAITDAVSVDITVTGFLDIAYIVLGDD